MSRKTTIFFLFAPYNSNNNHTFGRNGTYVQNIYIQFYFYSLVLSSYQASAEQFSLKQYSELFTKYILEYLFQFKNLPPNINLNRSMIKMMHLTYSKKIIIQKFATV